MPWIGTITTKYREHDPPRGFQVASQVQPLRKTKKRKRKKSNKLIVLEETSMQEMGEESKGDDSPNLTQQKVIDLELEWLDLPQQLTTNKKKDNNIVKKQGYF